MASAIIKLQEFAEVALPDINVARFGFTPDAENNSVMFGLRGISRVGEPIIRAIMEKRPFTSLADFCDRMVDEDGKKQISKDRVVNLIKAGAFNALEKQSREQILSNYLHTTCEPKTKLTLQNFAMLVANELIPADFNYQIRVYNFTKYIRKQKLANTYILDSNAMSFYTENNYPQTNIKQMTISDGMIVDTIAKSTWDYIYESEMNKIRAFIKNNHDILLQQLNEKLFAAEWNKYAGGDELKWELDSLNFYYSGHPLENLVLPVDISGVKDLTEDEFDGFWTIKGKQVPKYKLRTIVGAVIDKDTTKGTFILSCPDGVVNVKVFKQQFARYAHTLSETDDDGNKTVLENSFFDKGTFLAVTGILKGDTFIPKVYKNTGFDAILKIVLDANGNLDYLMRKAEE
jgi:DNA polymerase-3 subunit alpha